MAAPRRPPPDLDAALTVVLVLDRLMRVSEAELDAAIEDRDKARETTARVIEWMHEVQRREEDGRADDERRHEATVSTVSRVKDLLAQDDPEYAFASALELARQLSIEMPSADLVAWIGDRGDAASSPPWVMGRRTAMLDRHRATLAGRLPGKRVDPPHDEAAAAIIRQLTAEPDALWERPKAATQIAIRRPLGHSHHGLYLGDGSVVHFAGEPGRGPLDWRKATIQRVPLTEFLGADDARDLEQVIVVRGEEQSRVATLRPGLASWRAAGAVGSGGGEYNLLSNNCEHFASWALLGVPMSGQVKGAAHRAAGLSIRALDSAEGLAAALGYALQVQPAPLDQPLLKSSALGELPIDIGRARWANDLGQMVFWLPLWGEGRPLGGADLPWSVGHPAHEGHVSCPSIDLESGWHASLIAYPHGEAFWLTGDGAWFEATIDLDRLLERRIASSVVVARELRAGPGRLAQKLISLLAAHKTPPSPPIDS